MRRPEFCIELLYCFSSTSGSKSNYQSSALSHISKYSLACLRQKSQRQCTVSCQDRISCFSKPYLFAFPIVQSIFRFHFRIYRIISFPWPTPLSQSRPLPHLSRLRDSTVQPSPQNSSSSPSQSSQTSSVSPHPHYSSDSCPAKPRFPYSSHSTSSLCRPPDSACPLHPT